MDNSADNLHILVEVARRMGRTFELGVLLETIEQAVRAALDCERAAIFLYDAGRDELHSAIATGVSEIRFPATQGIAGTVAQSKEVLIVPDAYADPRFNRAVDKRTGFRTRNLLTLPMLAPDGDLIGVLQVLNKKDGPFTADDAELAGALGSLTGVAVRRQLLLDEAAAKQRLDQELRTAREIQDSLLPERDPDLPGFDISGWSEPAEATGGDCFDFRRIDEHRLMLMIADATGHGMGPALIVAQCRAMFRAIAAGINDPATVIDRANRLLCDDLPDDRFVTSCFGILDAAAGCLDYVSAGHGPLLFFRASDGAVESFDAENLPLAVTVDIPIEQGRRIQFEPGDLFVWLTDGFIEWADAEGRLYGKDRLIECILRHRRRSCREIIGALHDDVLRFGNGTPQADDLTAVLIKRTEVPA